jgi:hypothetical protein
MTKLFTILIFISLTTRTFSQSTHLAINSITIFPSSPTTIDNVKLVTNVITWNIGALLNHSATTNTVINSVQARACYFSGFLTSPSIFIDTISLGLLPSGSYTANFRAISSSIYTLCVALDSALLAKTFTVTNPTGIKEFEQKLYIDIFPNPSNKNLIIKSNTQITKADIIDLNGTIIHSFNLTNKNIIDIEDLKVGIYFLTVTGSEQRRTLKFIKTD